MTHRLHALGLLALGATLAACGARPTTSPVGKSTHALTRSPAPTTFWRGYTTIEASGHGAAADCDSAEAMLDDLPAGADVASAPLFEPGTSVEAPTAHTGHVFCVHTAEIPRQAYDELPDPFAPVEYRPRRASALAGEGIKQAAASRFSLHAGLPTRLRNQAGDVRVAVLDSAAPGEPGLPGLGGISPHGEDMALLIRAAVCPNNTAPTVDCPEVVTDVALDLDADGAGLLLASEGGRFGDPGMVARAIHRAVDAATADQRRLVINLSVGWTDDSDSQRVSIRAVEAAIRQARDAGAIVIAAAGNDEDGAVAPSAGMMQPGAWSTQQYADGLPLVISVGPLDADGEPTANARAYGATPPSLWAYGAHGVGDARFLAPGERRARFDGPLWTGSSVSAAVVSAAAAAMLANGRPPVEVMSALQQEERADICTMAELPCTGGRAEGPSLGNEPAMGPPRDNAEHWPAECRGMTLSQSADPALACPSAVIENPLALPRVDPQPNFPGCDVCAFDADSGKLVVKLSADAASVVLRVTDGSNTRWITLAGQLQAGEERVFAVDPGKFDALDVSGKVDLYSKTTSFEDPVMVWP